MIPINFLPPLPVEPLKKSVRRARLRKPYRVLKEAFITGALLSVFFGASYLAYTLESNISPGKTPALTSGYHGYSGGTTQFRELEIRDGGKVALYAGNTNIGDASSDVFTIGDTSSDTTTYYGNLTVTGDLNVTGTLTYKDCKCQN